MYPYHFQFESWAQTKLSAVGLKPLVIPLSGIESLSAVERTAMSQALKNHNFFLYEINSSSLLDNGSFKNFASCFGLSALDKHLCVADDQLTKIFDEKDKTKSFYIPYTNKPINWHTDGYYNSLEQCVFAFILHCEQPAFEGGENALMDMDQVFIHVMRQNPQYIEALMKPDVMTVPENRKNGVLLRPETSTAIFSVLNERHDILMRYSLRKKNISFKQDTLTQEALSCLDEFINSKSSPHTSIKLKAGQGVVCNNVLHKRTAFKDKIGSERLYYRARYYNRININN